MSRGPYSLVYRSLRWILLLLRRHLRRLVFWVLFGVALLLSTAAFVLNSPAAVTWAVQSGLPRLNEHIPGEIALNAWEGTFGDWLRLEQVQVRDDEGTVVLSVEEIALRWDPWDLLVGQVSLSELSIEGPSVGLERRKDGRLGLAAAFSRGSQQERRRGLRQSVQTPIDISLDSLRLSGGRFRWTDAEGDRVVLEEITGEASWSWRGQEQDLALRSLRATPKAPFSTDPIALRGGAQLSGLELSVDQLEGRWKHSSLVLSGPLGFLSSIELDLRAGLELDSVDLASLWTASPFAADLKADLRLAGRPDRGLAILGELTSASGGRVSIEEARIAPNPDSEDGLTHRGRLLIEELSPRDLLRGGSLLPDRVHGHVGWNGSGTSLDDLSGDYSLDMARFEFAEIPVESLQAKGSLTGPSLVVDGGVVRLGEGEINLSGETDFTERSFFVEVAALGLDLTNFRRVSADWLRSGEGALDGFVRGHWGGEQGLDLTSAGDLSITNSVIGPVKQRALSGEWDVRLQTPLSGLADLQGSFELDGLGVDFGRGPELRSLSVAGRLEKDGGSYRLRASRGGEQVLRTRGRLDWSRYPTLLLEGKSLDLRVGAQRVQSEGEFDVKLRRGAVQFDHLTLKSETGTLRVQGSYNPASGVIGGGLRLRGLDLAEVPGLAGALSGKDWAGELPSGKLDEIFLRAGGSLAAPELSVRGVVAGFKLGVRPAVDLAVDIQASEGSLTGWISADGVARLDLRQVPVQFRLDGRGLPLELSPEDPWDVELDIPDQGCSVLASLFSLSLPTELEPGRLAGNLSWQGSTENLQIRAVTSLTSVQAAGRSINAQVGWTLLGDAVEFGSTRLKTAAEGTILHLEGGAKVPLGGYLLSRWGPTARRETNLSPHLSDISVAAVFDKVDMSLVHLLEPALEPITGLVRGNVQFSGRADEPVLSGELTVLGARIGGRELHPIELTADLSDDRLSADFSLRPRVGGALRARSEVTFPLRLQPLPSLEVLLGSEDLVAELSGEGFPLDVVLAFVPDLSDESGSLTVGGQITGSLLAPEPSLELRIEDGRACARKLGLCYEGVRLSSRLRPDRLDISELWADTVPQVVNPIDLVRGRVRPGQGSGLGLRGSVGLDGWRPGDVELQLDLTRSWLMYSRSIQVQLDGEIGVRGTYPGLEVSGDLDVQNVEVDLGQDSLGHDVEQLTLPKGLRVHRESSPRGPGEAVLDGTQVEDGLRFLDELRAAASARVDLHLTNNVNVSLAVGVAGQGGVAQAANLLGSVEPELILGGDLELIWKRGKAGAVGEIRTEKGSKLTVLTRPFSVEEGSSVEFVGAIDDAQLAIRALQRSSQGDVAVVVSGQLSAPQIDFESEEFEDPADIMSVLLTGKPLSELSAAEGGGALGQITETLAGFGTKAFGKFVPVDRLAVDIGDDISSGSVEAGKALSPWLFFLTRFRWGAEEDENRVEGQLEFRFDRRGYVEVSMGDRLVGSADVVWKIQF